MANRTRTYIAADWTGDKDAVDRLHAWNDSDYWDLSFPDAHDLAQARDSSLSCSIKRSLAQRLDASKTFVLIVGNNTRTARAGSCQYCSRDNADCGNASSRSYINYECYKAVRDNLKIVVLYNAASVDKSKCPEAVRSQGTHVAMRNPVTFSWNYPAVRVAVEN